MIASVELELNLLTELLELDGDRVAPSIFTLLTEIFKDWATVLAMTFFPLSVRRDTFNELKVMLALNESRVFLKTVGAALGRRDGVLVGARLWVIDGEFVMTVGTMVGECEGATLGKIEGGEDGILEGAWEGWIEGDETGDSVGESVWTSSSTSTKASCSWIKSRSCFIAWMVSSTSSRTKSGSEEDRRNLRIQVQKNPQQTLPSIWLALTTWGIKAQQRKLRQIKRTRKWWFIIENKKILWKRSLDKTVSG